MVGDLLSGLAAPVLFVAAGAGLQALLPRPLERTLLSRIGFAYLLGVAWCTTTIWMASGVGVARVSRASFLVAGGVAVVAGVAAILARRGDFGGWRRMPWPRRGGGWATGAATVLMIVVAAGQLADALVHPVADFDGRMVWGTLARHVQAEGTVLPEVVTDPEAYVIHPRYPLVLPLAQVAAAELAGQPVESRAVRPLYALFLPALFCVLLPTLERLGGRLGAALVSVALLVAPVVLESREVGPRGTYSDLPLAAMLAGGVVILLGARTRRESWRGLAGGLLFATAVGVKNEGLVLAPFLVALLVIVARRGRRRAALMAAMLVLAGVVAVAAWRSQIPNRNDEAYFEELSVTAILSGFADRAPVVLSAVAEQTLSRERWGYLFWVLPLLVATGWRRMRGRWARVAGAWIVVGTVTAFSGYSVYGDTTLVAVTWNRFLVQMLAPIAMVAAASVRTVAPVAGRRL